MKDSKQPDRKMKEAFETKNEGEASYGLSVWLGAIFFFLIHGGSLSFDELYSEQHKGRNLRAGYLLTLIFVLVGLMLGWFLVQWL